MSMADYYNGIADANMRQFWSNVGGPIGKSDIDRVIEKANRNMDIANAEIDKAWANYVGEKKTRVYQQLWAKGLGAAIKIYIKEHYPDTWEKELDKIRKDMERYAIPKMHREFALIDNAWPNYVNDERAKFELPEIPGESEITDEDVERITETS